MIARAAPPSLRLPRAAGAGAVSASTFDSAMQMLERADSASVKIGSTPTLPAVILTAPDGSSWGVTVAADGSLQTARIDKATARRGP